ncbi:MAG: RNA polymerase sigma factor, partial [Phycisphaerales bacterium]
GGGYLAADAVQETWVRVIRFGGSFNGKSSLKTWLYRVAINECRRVKARVGNGGDHGTHETRGTHGTHGDACLARVAAEDGVEPVARDEVDSVREAVRGLSAERRIVVLLCYHRGMTHEQAAEILGLPVGTLKTRLRAAMTELRAKLAAGENVAT